MVFAIQIHVQPNTPAIRKIKNCKIQNKKTKKLKKGRECSVFESGLIVFKKCDNTLCASRNSLANELTNPYCTSVSPNHPTVNNVKIIKGNSDLSFISRFQKLSNDLNSKDCERPNGLDIHMLIEESIGKKTIVVFEGEGADEEYKFLSQISEDIPCLGQIFSEAGIGPIMFVSKGKERIYLPMRNDSYKGNLPYPSCF